MSNELARHDWDFSDCKEAELDTCVRYEYCRESEPFRKLALHLRDATKSPLLAIEFFGVIGGFPKTPWLDLPVQERQWYLSQSADLAKPMATIHMMFGIEKHVHVLFPDGRIDWREWQAMDQKRHPEHVQGWFSMPKGKLTRKEALQQIDAQFKALENSVGSPFLVDKGGRGGPRDKLQWIGAFRAVLNASAGLNHGGPRTPKRAAIATRSFTGNIKKDRKLKRIAGECIKGIYGADPNWREAIEKAKRELAKYDALGRSLIASLQ